MHSTIRFCAMTFAAAGLLAMPAAHAQNPPPSAPSQTAPRSTAPATISDAKLDAAAAAVKRVSAVRDTFEQKIAEAPAAEKQRLAGEANDAMRKAIADQGLSVEEYVTIMEVAQNDAGVRDKLLQRLK